MKGIRLLMLSLILSVCALGVSAQMLTPIKWSATIDMANDNTTGTLKLVADIDDGWHLYGLELPEAGPNPTQIELDAQGLSEIGKPQPSVAPIEKFDEMFGATLVWWASPKVEFTVPFVVENVSDGYRLNVAVTYQGCNDEACIPPSTESFEFSSGKLASSTNAESATMDANSLDANPLWQPVDVQQQSMAQSSWLYIFIWGFLGGLLALLTPCVWPMIPMTVSFFLKQSSNRARAVKDAAVYGMAIVVIYLIMGLAITLIFGASKLNDLSTNAVFNLLFFLLLVVFAISFFGAFDIKLPSRWSNSIDAKAERTTGILSIFFMAFTLVLVSFSCTGPIIGTLLVEAASMGDISGPAIGMGAFALALAIPFSLFAMFPSWLKEMPRSGGWLNSVKVVLGFLELALSLKFLSVADLAYGWHILDREIFIALWIVMFILLGMYLLGKIRFSHDSPVESLSVSRFFMALASLSFAVYLLPGLWGAPLKGVSAFVPPLYTQDFSLYTGLNVTEYDDYDEGMAAAAELGRPVLIDFSGYGCVNCRKMEGAVLDTEEVSALIRDNYVMIKLMVDDKHNLPRPLEVSENGRQIKLTTVGEKWSYLQRHKFGANTQPYYVALDNNGNALNSAESFTEDAARFAEWLAAGIENYKK